MVPRKSKTSYRRTSRFLTKQIYNIPADKTYAGDKRAFNQQESILAVFVDFSRAYDSIWRAKLIAELKNMNIERNMLAWFSRFLDQRWTKVKYGETFSKYKQTKLGLHQGAVTSTTLFNVHINDLPNIVRNTKTNIGMYADDIVIWASTKNNAKQHETL